jgi:PBSX family phage portal protein
METKRNYPEVNVRAFGFTNPALPKSNIVDPFEGKYGGSQELAIITPPYNPLQLMRVPEYSKILPQCIRAMVTNVHGYGWDLVRAPHIDQEKELPQAAVEEKRMIESIFGQINNEGQNFTLLSQDMQDDKETCGAGYVEIVRNGEGRICEMYLLPAYQIRLTDRDKTETEYAQAVRNADGQYEDIPRIKRFRRFVQLVDGKKIFFKEFGDPRVISSATGKEVGKPERPATEVLMFKIRSGYTLYGVPRWIGQLISTVGARKAEEINYAYFDNKAIPPLVVMVSGGAMAEKCVKRLEELFEHDLKGQANFHKALILEALPAEVGEVAGEKFGHVTISIKSLTEFMQKDALFMEYGRENVKMVRSAFRLPPIYVGLTDDYTRATALESIQVAETQVFQPEREAFAYQINSTIMSNLKINYWSFKLIAPRTTDYPTIVNALASIKEAQPVGLLQEAAAELLGKRVREIDEELYGTPLGVLMAGASMAFEPGDEGIEKAAKTIRKFLDYREQLVKTLEENK